MDVLDNRDELQAIFLHAYLQWLIMSGWIRHIKEAPKPVDTIWGSEEPVQTETGIAVALTITEIYDPPESRPIEHGNSRELKANAGRRLIRDMARQLGIEAAEKMRQLEGQMIVEWPEFKVALRENGKRICAWYAESVNERV